MKIETEIANATTKIIEENNGVFIPPTVESGTRMHFAIDNTDFHNDTPNGKLEFHGTGQILFQKQNEHQNETTLTIERSSRSTIIFKHNLFVKTMLCHKPTPQSESFPSFSEIVPSTSTISGHRLVLGNMPGDKRRKYDVFTNLDCLQFIDF